MGAVDEETRGEARPTGVGPGERLQAARIQQGLSLEEVAERMHLSANILEALEENNFEEITAPIFVKGYLRAYARALNLPQERLLSRLETREDSEAPPPLTDFRQVLLGTTPGDSLMKLDGLRIPPPNVSGRSANCFAATTMPTSELSVEISGTLAPVTVTDSVTSPI